MSCSLILYSDPGEVLASGQQIRLLRAGDLRFRSRRSEALVALVRAVDRVRDSQWHPVLILDRSFVGTTSAGHRESKWGADYVAFGQPDVPRSVA